MKILVTTLVRDNENWISQFQSMFESLKTNFPKISFESFIFENDSRDSTKSKLFGPHISHDFGHPRDMGSRTTRLAFYRNELKNKSNIYFENVRFDFVLMVDSNILFGNRALENMLETMHSNPDVAMVIPHAMVKHSVPCQFYYDTFAMKKGQFDSVVECTHSGARHDRHCHYYTGKTPSIRNSDPRVVEVDYGFGGFVLVRKQNYDRASWGVTNPSDCEHWKFCDEVGKIVMDRKSKVLWYE